MSSIPTAPQPAPQPASVPVWRRRHHAARWAVAAIAIVLGVVQGAVWAQVAPGRQFRVFPDGGYGNLPTSDYHPFDDVMIFVLSGAAIGLVVAAAAWRVRAIRGTLTLVTVLAGTAVGAAVAYGVGLWLATGVDPATVGSTGQMSIVVAAPTLGTPLALLAEPLVAVATYTFLVAWDGRPDLGRRRLTEPAGSEPAGSEPAGSEPAGTESGRSDPEADH